MRRRRQRAASSGPSRGNRATDGSARSSTRNANPGAEKAGKAGNQAVDGLVERSRKATALTDEPRAAADPAADAAAHLLDADAATVRGHVMRSRDAPSTGSLAGRHLLSHELAHVLQQRIAASLLPVVGVDDSALESAADMAADGTPCVTTGPRGATAVPAVQRQSRPGSENKPDTQPSRHPLVEQRLAAYLQRVCEAQNTQSVRVTDEVRGDLRRLVSGDLNTSMRLDAFLGVIGPREPESMASAITKLLPDSFDAGRSAYLETLPAEAPSSRLQRGIDLVKRTEPYVSPEAQQAQWEFDRRAKELRSNDNVIGPFGVDLQRAIAIGRGLPEVITPKPKTTVPQPLAPTTEELIGALDDAELVPRAERGSARADEFAVASDVARDVARRLADAQRRRHDHIEIRLGANYKDADDRHEILDALEKIVRRVAESVPGGADEVREVEVYFGDLRIRRFPLRETAR